MAGVCRASCLVCTVVTSSSRNAAAAGSGPSASLVTKSIESSSIEDSATTTGTKRTGVPPRGMRERQIVVDAREQWTDTEIDVRSGQQIYFTSTGETRWGRDRRDGAAGERNSPLNPNRPLPNRPAAALIGRIGDSNQIFFIGADGGPFRARDTGRLYLGINDDVLTDNSGNLRVTVSY